MTAATARRWVQPEPGDTFASIAARELPALPAADALRTLQSWNLHLVLRPGTPGVLIGADVVWLEPPRPKPTAGTGRATSSAAGDGFVTSAE